MTSEFLAGGRIHPALHIDERGVVVGRVTDAGHYHLVTDRGQVFDPEALRGVLALMPRPYPDLAGRWPDEDAGAFVADGEAPSFSEVLARLIRALGEAVEFHRPEQAALVATWAVASYFHPLFLTFPRLALAGEKGSGKSKILTVLQATAFNALLMLMPTSAVVYRLIREFRPSLLLDEMEGLGRDDARNLLAIINSGYRTGGTVPRCEGAEGRRVESFSVYAPLALAAIKSVNGVTEDRCIPLVLQHGTDRRRINAEIDPGHPCFARIRSGCYRLLLGRWEAVRDAYLTRELPEWLTARARQLWRPLLAVAACADDLALVPDLLALAREHVADRDDLSAEGEALLAVLAEHLGAAPAVTVRPGALAGGLRRRLGRPQPPTAEQVSAWLRRLGLRRSGKDREGARYEIHAEQLRAMTARYTPEATVTPSPSLSNSLIYQAK